MIPGFTQLMQVADDEGLMWNTYPGGVTATCIELSPGKICSCVEDTKSFL